MWKYQIYREMPSSFTVDSDDTQMQQVREGIIWKNKNKKSK